MIIVHQNKKVQVCKQQQTASGNINLFMPITNLGYIEMYANFCMGVMPQYIFLLFHTMHVNAVKKGKETSKKNSAN